MASFALMVTRALFGLTELATPALGGSVAFNLFSRTANPITPSRRERQAIERYASIMADARRHRLRVRGGWVVAHVFKPLVGTGLKETALVVHGWNSRSDHMVPIIMQLRAAGYRVVALDLPGHGKSSGRRVNMANSVEACAEAGMWFGPFDVVVGHSFGGAVAINALAGSVRPFRPLSTEKLILVSSPNCMQAVFDRFSAYLRLGRRTRSAMAGKVRRLTGTPLSDFVGARQLAGLDVSTLVLHAPEDREVSHESAGAFGQAGGHVTVKWVPDAGHRRILSDARTLDAIASFLGGDVPSIAIHRHARKASAS